MVEAITSTTIESNAYDNIVSFLDDRTIIADPRDPSGRLKRVFVYDVDPLMKSLNSGGFPYIIAEYPFVEYDKPSVDGKTKEIKWTMSLTVRTARDGANQGTTGRGKQDMFSIGDDLQALFNTDTYKQQLAAVNMYFMKLTKNAVSSPIIDNKYLHESDYTLTFVERLTVSA